MARKLRVKRGDQVVVRAGKDKGKAGEILRVLKMKDRVFVQGVNMVKKHQRPSQTSPGGITEIEASIHISNVGLIDPKTRLPTRIGYRFTEDGTKVRYAKRTGDLVDK